MKKHRHNAKIIWFTGLSGAGKSTLSNKIYKNFQKKKIKIKRIDDNLFRKKNKTTKNFSKKGIVQNNLNIIKEIKKIRYKYDLILVSVISPFLITRKFARKTFKNYYLEVHVFCKVKTLIKRDTKGLYKKALQNKIKNLIGFRSNMKYQKSKYEIIKIDTDKLSVKDSVKIILNKIKS